MSNHENTWLRGQQLKIAQDIEPVTPEDGQLWYYTVDQITRQWDANRSVWKDISGPSDENFFLDDGLISHFKMDEGVVDQMTDELAAHELDRFGPFAAASTTGVLNLARSFVGNSAQYYANATSIGGTGSYTVAGHFRFDGVGDGPLFMSGWTAGAIDKVFELSNDKIEFFDAGGLVVASSTFLSDVLTSGEFKTLALSVDYGGRWRLYVNGFQFDSGTAPAIGIGLEFGQLRLGGGLAFTVDSVSIYNDRAQDEYFAVTYHNSGLGIEYSDYSNVNIRRAPISILARGIDDNKNSIEDNAQAIIDVEQNVIDELEPRIKGIATDHRNVSWETTSTTAVQIHAGTFAQDYLRNTAIYVQASINITLGADIHDSSLVTPSTDYHIVIFADSTGVISSPTAKFVQDADYPFNVTLPSGYDVFRRIGTAGVDSGSLIRPGSQYNHVFRFSDQYEIATGLNAANFTSLSVAIWVPIHAKFCEMRCETHIGNNDTRELYTAKTGTSGSTGGVNMWFGGGTASFGTWDGDVSGYSVNTPLDASGTFAYRTVSTWDHLYLHGYYDSLEN